LCLDSDEVGQETAKKIADKFKPGKCRILKLAEGKDPNEYLKAGKNKAFVDEWWKAPAYLPANLKVSGSLWNEIINRPKHFQVDYPWPSLNKMTYGARLSEAVLLMADTGAGKTSVIKELEYSIAMNPSVREKGYKLGILHLEEPNYDTALGFLSIHKDKPYHLPDTERTTDELKNAFDEVLGDDKMVLYDHFGSNEIETILDKIRHMVAMGCKYIFIDHLSIIVSDHSGDERKQLDEISTKLKTLTMELNVAVFAVIHTNREGQVRGSAGPEQLANIHISLHRNKKELNEWRRNVLRLVIEKNRFCGRTGPCVWLYYNPETGRLSELTQEEIDIYENGDFPAEERRW
jgi:twinkle protein